MDDDRFASPRDEEEWDEYKRATQRIFDVIQEEASALVGYSDEFSWLATDVCLVVAWVNTQNEELILSKLRPTDQPNHRTNGLLHDALYLRQT